MTAWGSGICESDLALAGMAELRDFVVGRLLDTKEWSETHAFAAGVGVLMQTNPQAVSPEGQRAEELAERARRVMEGGALSDAAKTILLQVGVSYEDHWGLPPLPLSAQLRQALWGTHEKAWLNSRPRALFEDPWASGVTQCIADRAVSQFARTAAEEPCEDLWDDLSREGYGLSGLSWLLALYPCRADLELLRTWRSSVSSAMKTFQLEPTGWTLFERDYYENVLTLLDHLIAQQVSFQQDEGSARDRGRGS